MRSPSSFVRAELSLNVAFETRSPSGARIPVFVRARRLAGSIDESYNLTNYADCHQRHIASVIMTAVVDHHLAATRRELYKPRL